jgi:hypothetical protein
VNTQGALPTEDRALLLLFGLVATGQITLRKLDGYTHLGAVIRQGCARREGHRTWRDIPVWPGVSTWLWDQRWGRFFTSCYPRSRSGAGRTPFPIFHIKRDTTPGHHADESTHRP